MNRLIAFDSDLSLAKGGIWFNIQTSIRLCGFTAKGAAYTYGLSHTPYGLSDLPTHDAIDARVVKTFRDGTGTIIEVKR